MIFSSQSEREPQQKKRGKTSGSPRPGPLTSSRVQISQRYSSSLHCSREIHDLLLKKLLQSKMPRGKDTFQYSHVPVIKMFLVENKLVKLLVRVPNMKESSDVACSPAGLGAQFKIKIVASSV